MDIPKSMIRSQSPPPTSRFLKIGISPYIGTITHTTTQETGLRRRTTFQSDRDSELALAREVDRREKLAEREERKRLSAPDSEYSAALDIK